MTAGLLLRVCDRSPLAHAEAGFFRAAEGKLIFHDGYGAGKVPGSDERDHAQGPSSVVKRPSVRKTPRGVDFEASFHSLLVLLCYKVNTSF
jgi:hypothetical protein